MVGLVDCSPDGAQRNPGQAINFANMRGSALQFQSRCVRVLNGQGVTNVRHVIYARAVIYAAMSSMRRPNSGTSPLRGVPE
jgi:hypothetical protein